MEQIYIVLIIVVAYLIGSISPSIIMGRAKGIDIKSEGSGNAGTTNALRVLGKKAAIITLLCDMLKGLIPTLMGLYFFDEVGAMICGVAALLGHIFPCFYGFKGGKGAATAVGTLLALDYRLALLSLLVAAIFLFISKRMSVGTICAAIAFPILTAFMHEELLPAAIVIAVIVILKHKSNIQRLIKGQEPVMSIFDKEK